MMGLLYDLTIYSIYSSVFVLVYIKKFYKFINFIIK